jgi:hypothetical protein
MYEILGSEVDASSLALKNNKASLHTTCTEMLCACIYIDT